MCWGAGELVARSCVGVSYGRMPGHVLGYPMVGCQVMCWGVLW